MLQSEPMYKSFRPDLEHSPNSLTAISAESRL
jgi:hypothetical protein